MKTDLDAEKRALTKHWAKRERQLAQVIENMSSMFGDIQGISGSALPDIKALALSEQPYARTCEPVRSRLEPSV